MNTKIFEVYSFPGNHEGSVFEGLDTDSYKTCFTITLKDRKPYQSESLSLSQYLHGVSLESGKEFYLIPTVPKIEPHEEEGQLLVIASFVHYYAADIFREGLRNNPNGGVETFLRTSPKGHGMLVIYRGTAEDFEKATGIPIPYNLNYML
ncbi:hypothetical protein V0288_09275 [Pannus brasiliensis CCIBt3594]|uniref:Uncharacterized protein n=1 Tax=Pannus brasiliensis CCIBt3594 TaxID=1427578 RepID=A0AAW9QX13_9CHRO